MEFLKYHPNLSKKNKDKETWNIPTIFSGDDCILGIEGEENRRNNNNTQLIKFSKFYLDPSVPNVNIKTIHKFVFKATFLPFYNERNKSGTGNLSVIDIDTGIPYIFNGIEKDEVLDELVYGQNKLFIDKIVDSNKIQTYLSKIEKRLIDKRCFSVKEHNIFSGTFTFLNKKVNYFQERQFTLGIF